MFGGQCFLQSIYIGHAQVHKSPKNLWTSGVLFDLIVHVICCLPNIVFINEMKSLEVIFAWYQIRHLTVCLLSLLSRALSSKSPDRHKEHQQILSLVLDLEGS